jgi:hypothetical protein
VNSPIGLINGSTVAPFRETPQNYPSVSSIPAGQLTGPLYPFRGYEFYDGPNELKTSSFYGYKSDSRNRASTISMLRQDQFRYADRCILLLLLLLLLLFLLLLLLLNDLSS